MHQGLPAWRTQPPKDLTSGREQGQALLELALVVPILALLLMAIFQFALVVQTQVGLTNAVREAARRVAAIEADADPTWMTWSSMQSWVQAELCGPTNPPCDTGLLRQNVQAFDGSRLGPSAPAVSFCTYDVDLGGTPTAQYRVDISVVYRHPVYFGLLAYATDLVDGVGDGDWNLSAAATMRLENIDPAQPGFSGDPAPTCPP